MILRGLHRLVAQRPAQVFLARRHVLPGATWFPSRWLSSDVDSFPSGAKVVICGGGVVGTSVAYHLAEHGWKDIVLLEQGSLSCGTTWHAAGLLGSLKSSTTEMEMALYTQRFYRGLEAEGYGTGWKQCGSLFLARTPDRLILYKRQLITAQRFGIEGEVLTPREIADRYPLLHTDDLVGGVFVPTDGVANPTDVTMALGKKAKEKGVSIQENTQVKRVLTRNNKVHGVETDKGKIECQYFVNCAGMWARELGQLSEPRVRVPLHPCEHFYIVTKPMEGMDRMFPVVRDYDGYVYIREWSGGIIGGGFEPKAKPVFHKGIPEKFQFQLLPEDWDHFHIMLDQLLHRIPSLENAEVRQLLNGPESFTPDGKFIIGEAPELDNYFVAAGMNSIGITVGPPIGRYLSEWIVNGEPSTDLWAYDVRRFVDMHNNNKFLRDRVTETLGLTVRVNPPGPLMRYEKSRKLSTSALYPREEAAGAQFVQNARGHERAAWFIRKIDDSSLDIDDAYLDTEIPTQGSFGRPVWFDRVKSEYWACREGVCLIDMSTFTKFELRSAGHEATEFLQNVCSNDIDRPIGMVIHTGMQNHHGGYENDCSIVRLADNHYFMIGPTAQQTRSYAWLRDHLPQDGSVQLTDVTSMYTAINVIGPKAQELLSELTDTSLQKQDFHSMTCKVMDVGQASGVKAMRLTHSGEDGWCLYIPSEYALHVYDSLMSVGKDFGVRNAGYYALRALRTEKFFAYWGTDLTPHTTPMECGREYRVKFNVGNFIGYDALLQQKGQGIKKRLVQLLLENHNSDTDPWPWGGEPIYRNGKFVGTATSTAYGFTLDRQVVLGYVSDYDEPSGEARYITNDYILKNARYEVDIAGERFPAKINIYPPTLAPAAIEIYPPQAKTTS